MIYVFKSGKFVKIGYSTDVSRRLREMQTANPEPIELVGSIPGTLTLEKTIHRKLRAYRCGGGSEWYKTTGEVLEFVNNLRSNGLLRLLEN